MTAVDNAKTRTSRTNQDLQQRWHGWGSPVGLGLHLVLVGAFVLLLAMGLEILSSI